MINNMTNLSSTNSNIEEWRSLEKYPGYMVSSFGRLKSIKGYICLAKPTGDGYIRPHLKINGKSVSVYLHRLIALAFIQNPENKPQVDHINSIKHDNNIENLQWVTASENSLKRISLPSTLNQMKINQFSYNGEYIKTWSSVTEIANILNVEYSTFLYHIDKHILYKNFIWERHIEIISGEEWRTINYRGYQITVSSEGRICDLKNKVSYGTKTNEGYMKYHRKENGNDIHFSIHRLVMMAGNPIVDEEKYVVDHINGIKNDNRYCNLRWATVAQNNQYAHDSGNFNYNPVSKGVDQYSLDGRFIQHFESYTEAANFIHVAESSISRVCSGQNKTSKGFIWKSTGYNS